MFNELVAAGADADYVLLPSDPGGAVVLLAANSYAQVWVYDLSAGQDPWDADFEAIADWWVNDSGGEIIADGRILSSYFAGRHTTEGRILAENYFHNLRAEGGGLLLSTDHDAFANIGANTIGELIGIDPFIGNFGGAFPVDTTNPLMNTPNLIKSLFNDTTTGQAPFGLQPNGLILDAVGFHSGNPQTPGISSTIDGSLNLVVSIVAPEPETQLCAFETTTATAESTGATGIVDYVWTSDLDGALGFGASILLDAGELTEGIHLIRVVAEDEVNIDDADITVEIGGCVPLSCGDGVLDPPAEQCDDGNLDDGDGCNFACQLENPIVHNPYPLSNWPESIQLNNGQDSAYIALQESGLDIHDVFDRDNAAWISNFDASSDCSPGNFFADEIALIEEDGEVDAIISGGECGVVGVDVTNSNNPLFIDSILIPFGLAEETAVMDAADGENLLLYVASFWQGLQIFEIVGECTSNCVVEQRGSIGAVDEWGASLAVWLEVVYPVEAPPQLLAYVASTEGLQIVDVTDPDAPILLGRLDTNPNDIPLADLDDVPQDVVVSGGLAFVPIWIGGFLVIDVTDPANPVLSQPVIPASPNTAFFKVEVSSRDNRIYVTEGISGLASFIQRPSGELVLEERFPIGVDDDRCTFDEGGVSDVCWAWAIDEVGELVSVTYGVLDSPQAGGFQLISMPRRSVQGVLLKTLKATPIPEPHLLILQGVGVLAVAGLGRLRRKRRERSTQG
jgi:cysteine-rich repeat protein